MDADPWVQRGQLSAPKSIGASAQPLRPVPYEGPFVLQRCNACPGWRVGQGCHGDGPVAGFMEKFGVKAEESRAGTALPHRPAFPGTTASGKATAWFP